MTDTATAEAPTTDLPALGFKLNFFKLIVRDLEPMVAFYARTFGFEESRRIAMDAFEEVMLNLPGDRFTLVLFQYKDGRAVDVGTGHGPIGFLTRDVDAAYARAIEQGATELHPPRGNAQMKAAFLRDPDGHEIEMIQIMRPAAAKE